MSVARCAQAQQMQNAQTAQGLTITFQILQHAMLAVLVQVTTLMSQTRNALYVTQLVTTVAVGLQTSALLARTEHT